MLSDTVLTRLQTLQPAIAAELQSTVKIAAQETDPSLLDLCIGYIDAALDCRDWKSPGGTLSEKEQAFIAFTEQFVTSVGTMTDKQVNDLLQFSTPSEVYAFTNALYVTDMSRRLEAVTRRVLL